MQNREQKTEKLKDKQTKTEEWQEEESINKMNTLITPGTVNETMPKTVDLNESE